MVLYPDRSIIFDVQQGVNFYKALPKGELAVLPNCGHNTYEHQPKNYIHHVSEFLRKNKKEESPSGNHNKS